MLKEQLKKQVVKKSIILGIVLLVLAIPLYLSFNYLDGKKSELKKVKKSIISANSQGEEIRNILRQLEKSLDTYKSIPKNKLASESGMTLISSRIRALSPLISKIKKNYYFASLEPILGKITKSKIDGISHLDVYESVFTLKFQAPSDEVVYSAIKTIQQEIDGYVYLSNFNITNNLTDINIKDYLKVHPYTVSGEISFLWKTLKKRKEDAVEEL